MKWRAALVSGTNDGQPEEIIRVSGPSIWPFIAACGTVLLFIGEMVHHLALIGVAAAIVIAAVVLWNRPEPVATTEEEEEAFEATHGISVRVDGGRTLATWGMGMAILVAAVAFGTALLGYFYLRIENEDWPPPGVPDPGLLVPALGVIAMAAATAAMARAHRSVRRGAFTELRGSLIGAGVLTLVAGGLQLYDLTTLDFSAQDHAYGSIFYLVAGFLLALALVGLVIDGVVAGAAIRKEFTRRRYAAVTNATRYSIALFVMWVAGTATLYLVPRMV